VTANERELFSGKSKMKYKTLTENDLLQSLASCYILLFLAPLPGIYLRKNIAVANRKGLSPLIDKICAESLSTHTIAKA
jgi:hypothetical protein